MEEKRYPVLDEEESVGMVSEPIASAATACVDETDMPDDVDYAQIVSGILQITPDIEDEIEQVKHGETVSMSEFKTMFAKWLE